MLGSLVVKLARLVAWLLLIAITFVTLEPAQDRPQTSFSHDLEHALAFVAVGVAFGCGYASRRLVLAAAAVPVIGAIELLQLWAPGRHARVEDFVVNLLTFWAALAITVLLDRIWIRGHKSATSNKN
jgi:VanZ family protein